MADERSDVNCGAAFVKADDDFSFGLVDNCGQRNPVERGCCAEFEAGLCLKAIWYS